VNLKWDKYSDQPEVMKDKALKKKINKATRWDSIKLFLVNIFLYPVTYVVYLLKPEAKSHIDTDTFFGMSVNLDKNPDETRELIDDLKVTSLLIRVPLHDIENLTSYIDFAEQFKDKEILINIMQDRRHVEDAQLLKRSLESIFQGFSHLTTRFQIGNAINRKKWAIFSMDEYTKFYKVAYDLKQDKYLELVLLGSSVIDFEYYFSISTLFNRSNIYYDQFSSLLYVDRRGAPENTQMGLDLQKKIRFLYAILWLSPKSKSEIVITETNWPISNTAPYAPTGEKECVSLEDHANYLVRYYLLALSTGVVKNVYWHQLIAPGYGLIDNRDNKLIKYPAYQAFKTMLFLLQEAVFIEINKRDGYYYLVFNKGNIKIEVHWSITSSFEVPVKNRQVILRDGDEIMSKKVTISESPVYFISEGKV